MAGAVHQSEAINHTFDFSLVFSFSLSLSPNNEDLQNFAESGGWMMMVVEDDGGEGETALIDGVVGVVGAGGERRRGR